MEVGTRVVKSVQHHNAVSTTISSARPIVSPSRLAKLPPISSGVGAEQEEEEGHQGHTTSSLFLKTATSELKETMQHLLCEVSVQYYPNSVIS